jgi:hypothetical protein
LRRSIRGIGDGILGLPFRSDEKHPATAGDGVGDRLQSLVQKWDRLGEIKNMNVVPGPENVARHFRVPAMRLMAEMRPCFEKAAHSEFWQSHGLLLSG